MAPFDPLHQTAPSGTTFYICIYSNIHPSLPSSQSFLRRITLDDVRFFQAASELHTRNVGSQASAAVRAIGRFLVAEIGTVLFY
jgi:hypothetical protein